MTIEEMNMPEPDLPERSLDGTIRPTGFQSIRVSRAGTVATIRLLPEDGALAPENTDRPVTMFAQHKELGVAVEWLARDESTRVIVLTGADDAFVVPSATRSWTLKDLAPSEDWALMQGLRQTLTAILDADTPVIARVNGDAIGYGSSLVYACDFVVAAEDALIADHHLGMGDLPYGRADFGFVPGDGGSVFVPLHMPPAMAREYLMLARSWSTTELAAAGVINYAVPQDRLDETVESLITGLLRRPRYALAWTKRVLNQPFRQRFTDGYEAGIAYEMLNIYQRRAEIHR
ncbi:enoyl-CoA hydratase/isomerase family protein [Nocardia rhamnosiphila]